MTMDLRGSVEHAVKIDGTTLAGSARVDYACFQILTVLPVTELKNARNGRQRNASHWLGS